MLISVSRKMMYSNDLLIERTLPSDGDLVAKIGDKVEPYTKLGMSKLSYGYMDLGEEFKFVKGKGEGSFFYSGEKVGKGSAGTIKSPFDGYITKFNNKYYLQQEDRDYWLLSGVWGEVSGVSSNSALIKTQTIDVHMAACNEYSFGGEFIVFPNPSELLEMQYLEKFAKDIFGKIIYVGDHAGMPLLRKAIELGAGGIITGSTTRAGLNLAKKHKMFLGAISGFGKIATPEYIFEILKEVSNRYVFVQGERLLLRIPVPNRFSDEMLYKTKVTELLVEAQRDMVVQVFVSQYFGWVGKIVSIEDNDAHVKLDDADKIVRVEFPNLVVLESESDILNHLHLSDSRQS